MPAHDSCFPFVCGSRHTPSGLMLLVPHHFLPFARTHRPPLIRLVTECPVVKRMRMHAPGEQSGGLEQREEWEFGALREQRVSGAAADSCLKGRVK